MAAAISTSALLHQYVASGLTDQVAKLLKGHATGTSGAATVAAMVSRRDETGATPLHVASAHNRPEMVRLLVSYRADPNVPNDSKLGGLSPLHLAARHNHAKVAQELIKAGADVNVKSATHSTPLHESSAYGHASMGTFLLSAGATDPVADVHGFGAHYWATKAGCSALTPSLKPHSLDQWAMLKADPEFREGMRAAGQEVARRKRLIRPRRVRIVKPPLFPWMTKYAPSSSSSSSSSSKTKK